MSNNLNMRNGYIEVVVDLRTKDATPIYYTDLAHRSYVAYSLRPTKYGIVDQRGLTIGDAIHPEGYGKVAYIKGINPLVLSYHTGDFTRFDVDNKGDYIEPESIITDDLYYSTGALPSVVGAHTTINHKAFNKLNPYTRSILKTITIDYIGKLTVEKLMYGDINYQDSIHPIPEK